MKSFLILLALLCQPIIAEASKSSFKLNPQLKENYLSLLGQAADFHKVIDQGDKKAIQAKIKETQEIIAKLYKQVLSVSQFHHKIHSYKLLKSIEEQLAAMRFNSSLDKNREKKNIKKLFNSFFELAQVYDLTKDMKDKIFYCSRDKSLWFQESGKAKNPINLNYKSCGRPIL